MDRAIPADDTRAEPDLDAAARFLDWLRRASEHVELGDLSRLAPRQIFELVRGFAREGIRAGHWSSGVAGRDEAFVEVVTDAARVAARRYFRLRVEGVEHVPAQGPVLLVGSHNGGVMPLDTLFTLLAIRDRFGLRRNVYLLGHDLLGYDPALRRLACKLGIVRAHPECGAEVLGAGHALLVYPGAAEDSWRPFGRRGHVELAGRTGFAKLALAHGAPIVPVVSAGTHEQLVVLSRGGAIARRLGLDRALRSEAFPIVLALPWGITSGFLPYLPLPAQTTLRFGAPLRWPELGPDEARDPAALALVYEQVKASMQAMLDALHAGRLPVVGKLPRAPGFSGR